jgi:hypothetical protein
MNATNRNYVNTAAPNLAWALQAVGAARIRHENRSQVIEALDAALTATEAAFENLQTVRQRINALPAGKAF